MTPVSATCPACLGGTGHRLYRVSSEEAAQHYVRRRVDPTRHEALRAHIEGLWHGNEAQLVRCSDCSLTFCDPFVAGDERFYTLAYERDRYPQDRWEFSVTRDDLARRITAGSLPADATLLELGAGDGAFVRTISPSLVSPGQITCTEYSNYGRMKIAQERVTVLSDDVRALGREHEGRYNVIALFQVFEHMADLDALSAAFDRLLRPGGVIYVSVPNGLRIDLQEQGGGLLDLPPNHTGRWNRRAFEAYAGRHGWRVDAHRTEPESALSRLRQHAEYRFMRARQREGTVASTLEGLRLPRRLKRMIQGVGAAFYGLFSIGTAVPLLWHQDAGATQWVVIVRTSA